MSARTTTGDGTVSNADGSVLNGGTPLGTSDTLTNSNVISIGANTTCGASPATGGTAAIESQGSAQVVLPDNKTLVVRGDLLNSPANNTRTAGFYQLDVGAGCVLEFDSSQAASPASQLYVCGPTASARPNARVRFAGTSGNRTTVRSNAAGGNARFSLNGFATILSFGRAAYTDFLRIGDASHSAIESYLQFDLGGGETDEVVLNNCTFTSCGPVTNLSNQGSETVMDLTGVVFTSSLGTYCWHCPTSSNAIGTSTGIRRLRQVVADKSIGDPASPPSVKDFSFYQCSFEGGMNVSGGVAAAQFEQILWRKSTLGAGSNDVNGAPAVPFENVLDCILLTDNDSASNAKFFASNNSTSGFTLDGALWHSTSTDAQGDLVSINTSPSVAWPVIARNCLCLPAGGGVDRPGALLTLGSTSANFQITAEHNTWLAGNEPAFVIGESAKPAAGVWVSLKYNIITSNRTPQGSLQYLFHDYASGGATTDVLAAANANHNATNNLKAGSAGKGYNATFSGTPGANDLTNVDPDYADDSRTPETWAASVGGAETTAGFLAAIRADPTLIIVAKQWVFDGYKTQNILLIDSSDGDPFGAAGYQAAPTGGGTGMGSARGRRLLRP